MSGSAFTTLVPRSGQKNLRLANTSFLDFKDVRVLNASHKQNNYWSGQKIVTSNEQNKKGQNSYFCEKL